MTSPHGVTSCDPTGGPCHVCGDVAVVGRIVDVDDTSRTGTVAFEGSTATVALDLIEARVGDDVLVHLGFAIERVNGRG